MTTKEQLHAQYVQLEEKRVKLLTRLEQRSEAEIHRSPASGAWSPIQVVAHLQKVEQASMSYIQKKISYQTGVPKIGMKHRLRMAVSKWVFRTPLKFKAPKGVAKFPDDLRLNQVASDWEQGREELKKMIEDFPENLLGRAVLKHPLAGRIGMDQALDFFSIHMDRHIQQINRSLKA